MVSLLATVTFMFSSCDNDDSSDTIKPLIELHEPEEGQALEIGNEHGVHFEMDLSDDVMLKSYKIEIHSNFDHHSHGGNSRAAQETVDFSFNRSYDVSGQKTAHIHHHDIVIPANATAGDYHLMVYCTDAAGNTFGCRVPLSLNDQTKWTCFRTFAAAGTFLLVDHVYTFCVLCDSSFRTCFAQKHF